MSTTRVAYRRQGGWSMVGDDGYRQSGRFGAAPDGGAVELVLTDKPLFRRAFSILPAAALDIDLQGGGEEDVTKEPLDFVALLWFMLEITSPGTGKSLRLGPQNVTNGWQGVWSGTDADSYVTVTRRFEDQDDTGAIWPAVDATHKVLRINNPSLVTVAGVFYAVGVPT